MRLISADSHVTEPAETYVDYIDPAWRDRAPRLVHHETMGDVFVIDGLTCPLGLGTISAAGRPAAEINYAGASFADFHRGGYDPVARLEEQYQDGVEAEVIYPSIGLALCGHRNQDYKRACFAAYNRWLSEFCGSSPRLIGLGMTAMRSPADGLDDLVAIKALGLRGVMMPGDPVVEDYDSPAYDDFWQASVELELPLSFHIVTGRAERPRGPTMNGFLAAIRGCQDIIGAMILGGVFERVPDLRIVCVEADAGWVPHFMYRMDHAWKRHGNWLPAGAALSRFPSEYFRDSVYVTFQDDPVALQTADLMNWRHLMWASDFPHSDSTWPNSRALTTEQAACLPEEQRAAIFAGNAAALYGIA